MNSSPIYIQREKMKLSMIKTAIGFLMFAAAAAGQAQSDEYRALVQKNATRMGPNGYAKCAAATVVMITLQARGDNLGRFKEQVDPFANFMAGVRNTLIARGTPERSLDGLIRSANQIIMSDPDPVLRGMKDFDRCYNEAVS